ncbi:MAG: hypothetical protein E6377_18645 [Clostridium sp.]|uniref:hypothetical protein n=1 Tax=Bacillota TaxID=1239 RepID=UPI00291008A0|nr:MULTISPECIES: hypothetical protein [Bacillota]MDU3678296.1 hypothetical protein [Clostridium sp.]MDU5763418.1 hypothetical protein [Veillonella sp.]MDU5784029.1 hypothetical protein [Clostridium sp.]MDU6876412.1 hypothetical protein [Clostridium sp.]MDU6937498.1 hypothetical protein [Clostridium sp.]
MNVNDAAIKAKIREYRKDKVLKATALRKLKREFGVSEKVLDEFWLEVKQEKKMPKKESVIKDTKEKLIASEEVTAGMLKQSLGEAKGQAEDKYINKDLEVVKATIKGKYNTYEKEGTKVKVGELEFKNEQDIENYKQREMARFMAELGEILDVMLMEV